MRRIGAATGLGSLSMAGAITETASANPYEVVDRVVPAHGANVTTARRDPSDIDWIVMHVAVGTYEGTVDLFGRPNPRRVSAHYVISNYSHTAGEPGEITKMVDESDLAHHAGGANVNSIGIEHEWHRSHGRYISDDCYRASAELVRRLAETYDVPLEYHDSRTCTTGSDTRGGIIGHLHTPSNTSCTAWNSDNRTCPYPDWNWDRFGSFLDDTGDGPAFAEGADVVSTADVNVRSYAAVARNVGHTQPEGERGTITDGPYHNDGFTWWHVEWENGPIGWSVQEYLAVEGSDADTGGDDESFQDGHLVQTTIDLNGRRRPGLDTEVTRVLPEGTTGEVVNGPATVDGVTWWGLHVRDLGVWVWCAEEYLERADFLTRLIETADPRRWL